MARATVLALATLTIGCSSEPQFSGIGPYHVNKLVLAKATGRCEPTDLPDGRKGSWCYGQPSLTVAGQKGEVDLYFGGTTPDSKVIEIQLQFRGCREGELNSWLTSTFGAPKEQRGARVFWENAHMFLIGELPSAPGRCLVRLLPKSEQAEVERIKAAP